MPTPSSDQPPSPPMPPSHVFPTCPDDLQTSATHECDEGADTESNSRHGLRVENRAQSPALIGSAQTIHGGDNSNSSPRTRDTILAQEGRASLGPSSRATTMSPRPQSVATAGTSPLPDAVCDEVNKIAHCDDDIAPSRATADPSRPGAGSSGRRSPDQTRNLAVQAADAASALSEDELYGPSMGSHFPSARTRTTSASSFLRPGSKFQGTQQSERQVYDVQVEIKHVDMRESFLCGYLRIQGLTEDHPTLTTYFEGEIIGPKYNFLTNHESWGASHKTDLRHWTRFSAFHPFRKQLAKGPVSVTNVSQRENIFMRWKEHFLVPDHRVRTITGASFEGFYYICFNQIKAEVSGIYFHSKSEKFQELELKHVPDRGCSSAVEFR